MQYRYTRQHTLSWWALLRRFDGHGLFLRRAKLFLERVDGFLTANYAKHAASPINKLIDVPHLHKQLMTKNPTLGHF
jgi:hypothetical protein